MQNSILEQAKMGEQNYMLQFLKKHKLNYRNSASSLRINLLNYL